MRKMFALIVAFVFVAGVAPVQAQGILRGGYMPSSPEGWYYYLSGNQVMMLQADNLKTKFSRHNPLFLSSFKIYLLPREGSNGPPSIENQIKE